MTDLNTILILVEQIQAQLQNRTDLSPELLKAVEHDLSKIRKKIDTNREKSHDTETIYIWSDGACTGNPGPGGWGTLVLKEGKYQELSGRLGRTTNNIMELTGALEGIRHTPEGSTIQLTSDSQYLVKGMTQWIKGWKRKGWKKADGNPVLNQELWMALDKESRTRKIDWKWVKGHAGHPQNERCDELARNAI